MRGQLRTRLFNHWLGGGTPTLSRRGLSLSLAPGRIAYHENPAAGGGASSLPPAKKVSWLT